MPSSIKINYKMSVQLANCSILVIITFSVLTLSHGYVGFHEACDQSSSATACDPSQELSCKNKICECVHDDMEHTGIQCVVLLEGKCYKSPGNIFKCIAGARCHYYEDPTRRQCLCDYQRSPTADKRKCMASHGATCYDSSECNPLDKLMCDFNFCRCPQPMNHVFKEKRNRCFIKVGGACTLNPAPDSVTCDPEENECLADLESSTGYSCQCLPGNHMEHFERQCVKGNLETCEDLAGDPIHPPCDVIAGLGCHDKKCQCFLAPDMVWDAKRTACTVVEGAACSLQHTDPAMWWIGFGEYYHHCTTGLECVPWEGHEYEGICRKEKTNKIQT